MDTDQAPNSQLRRRQAIQGKTEDGKPREGGDPKAPTATQRKAAIELREKQLAHDEAKRQAEFASASGHARKTTPMSRQEQKLKAQAKAQQQAYEDAMRPTAEVNTSVKRGSTPSLHVLNLRQRANDKAQRDEVREATTAAAKAVNKALTGSLDARRVARAVRKSGVEKVMREGLEA